MPDLPSILPTILGELAGAFVWVGAAVGVLVAIAWVAGLLRTSGLCTSDEQVAKDRSWWRGLGDGL